MDSLDDRLMKVARAYRPTGSPPFDEVLVRARARRRRAVAGTVAALVVVVAGVALALPRPHHRSTLQPSGPSASVSPEVSTCGGGDASGVLEYINFVKVDGRVMAALEEGSPLAPLVRQTDLGVPVTTVRCRLDSDGRATTNGIDDGTSSFLPVGTVVYRVDGYDPRCRVAATSEGKLTAYLAYDPSATLATPISCAVVPGLDPDATAEQAGDPATAPAAFQHRTRLPDCGFVDLAVSVNEHLSPGTVAARACFLDAVAAHGEASVVVRSRTIDVGPAYTFLSTAEATTTAWRSISSRFGGRGGPIDWTLAPCVALSLERDQPICR